MRVSVHSLHGVDYSCGVAAKQAIADPARNQRERHGLPLIYLPTLDHICDIFIGRSVLFARILPKIEVWSIPIGSINHFKGLNYACEVAFSRAWSGDNND